jgi:hypothetical protein
MPTTPLKGQARTFEPGERQQPRLMQGQALKAARHHLI